MLEDVRLRNVTVFRAFAWANISNVNLVIGENDTGKSNLLRMLYAVSRSFQEFTRIDDGAPAGRWSDLLAKKLQWTFQPPELELGKIVRKGEDRLRVQCTFREHGRADFSFGKDTTSEIRNADADIGAAEAEIGPQFVHTLFFPPKEVLTTLKAIASTREQRQIRGFGDTYYDLITALRQPQNYDEKAQELERVQDALDNMFPGKIRQREEGGFEYRRGPGRYDMTQTAEGIKKIGTLAHLLRNGEIQRGSILFFDEPSANLNPKSILRLVELLFALGRAGVQVFVATHSYVVLKQFQLLAREHEERTPLCVLSREDDEIEAEHVDLRDRIPENPIVSASVDLFERDLAQKLA